LVVILASAATALLRKYGTKKTQNINATNFATENPLKI